MAASSAVGSPKSAMSAPMAAQTAPTAAARNFGEERSILWQSARTRMLGRSEWQSANTVVRRIGAHGPCPPVPAHRSLLQMRYDNAQ